MFKRLTERSPKNGMAYLINVKQNEQDVESPYPNTLRCIMDSFNRLAAYEDSGLSPEELQELAKTKAEGCISPVKCPCDASEEAKELMDAKEEGRLVELPCKVGNTVYAVQGVEIIQCKVTEVSISESGISYIKLFSTDDRLADFRHEHFKKTVFLTREAAEKALEVGE